MWLGVLFFSAFLSLFIFAIISLFKRNGKSKRLFLFSLVSFIVFGTVAAIDGSSDKSQTENNNEQTISNKTENVVENVGQINDESKATFNFTVNDLKDRIQNALNQMGSDTNLKIISVDETKGDQYTIVLSENIVFLVDVDNSTNKAKKVALKAQYDSALIEKEDLDFSFLLLAGTVDDSLSYADRYAIKKHLGLSDKNINILDHEKETEVNNVKYLYKGSVEDGIELQAIVK